MPLEIVPLWSWSDGVLAAGCRDKNIVQFYGACVDQDQLMMVTELMENGDLFSALADPERMPRVLWYRRCVIFFAVVPA